MMDYGNQPKIRHINIADGVAAYGGKHRGQNKNKNNIYTKKTAEINKKSKRPTTYVKNHKQN